LLLWDGADEYEAAGNWTEESIINRVKEVLEKPEIPFHW
jgi:hypothetical protein